MPTSKTSYAHAGFARNVDVGWKLSKKPSRSHAGAGINASAGKIANVEINVIVAPSIRGGTNYHSVTGVPQTAHAISNAFAAMIAPAAKEKNMK